MKTILKGVKCLGLIALIAATLTGCTTSLSPDTYANGGAGQVNRVIPGVVVGARSVQVSDDHSTAGTIVGGLTGAVVGSTIGHGTGSALGAIGGAVAGGVLGNMAGTHLGKQTGIEYIIKTRGGSMLSVVQGPNPFFQRGAHVLVEYGGDRARVIADPSYQ